MDLKTLLSTQIAEINNKQTEIAALQTQLTEAQNAETILGITPGTSDKVRSISENITTANNALETLKASLKQEIKNSCASVLFEAQLIGPLSTEMQDKITNLNTKIENLDLTKLTEALTAINRDANKLSQEIHNILVEKQRREFVEKRNKISETLREFEALKPRCATAAAKPDLATLGLSAPAYTPEQEALAVQINNLLTGLIRDEKKLEELQGKLHQANKKIEADLNSFDKKYNAKSNAASLIAQLEPIAKVLGNTYGLEDRIRSLRKDGDLAGLANQCEETKRHLATNKSGILTDLKRVANEITDKYKFGISNATNIETLISNPSVAPETLAAALNTAISELIAKKIIKDAKLTTMLNQKDMATLQANYTTLNRANAIAEKAVLTQAEREQLEKDIEDLQKAGQTRTAKRAEKRLEQLKTRNQTRRRVQRLQAKFGSVDAFQRSVDLDNLIEAHDVSSLSTLTQEDKANEITRNAAEAQLARTSGNIRKQKEKENITYSRQVRRAISRGDAGAIRELVQKRQDIIARLENKLGVREIKGAMRELRKVDRQIVGRKNAKAIYGDLRQNLRQIHLIGGTALTLPKYLMDFTEDLGLDAIAGIGH